MARQGRHVYSQDYIRQCFDVWYLNSRPNPARLLELIPDFNGKKPTGQHITTWMIDGWWDVRADEMDAKAIQIADDQLVDQKVEILKRHQENAQKIATKALDAMMADGFDSSSAAVQAYFRATEEERKTQGFSDLLEKLQNMSNNQVRDEIIGLINRATENNQIVEGQEIKQITDDTVSSEE